MLCREIHVGKRFCHTVRYLLSGFGQFHLSKLCLDSLGLLKRSSFILLGMDCFQHLGDFFHLAVGHYGEDIPVEVNDTTLVFHIPEHLANRFDHPQCFISHYELDTFQTALFQPDEEVLPALQVFLQSFGGSNNFAISVATDTDCDEDGDILKLFTPAAFQENSVHIDVWIWTLA